jgi:hypothetical protein
MFTTIDNHFDNGAQDDHLFSRYTVSNYYNIRMPMVVELVIF